MAINKKEYTAIISKYSYVNEQDIWDVHECLISYFQPGNCVNLDCQRQVQGVATLECLLERGSDIFLALIDLCKDNAAGMKYCHLIEMYLSDLAEYHIVALSLYLDLKLGWLETDPVQMFVLPYTDKAQKEGNNEIQC